MSHCHSCGGVIGRDCWNPQECAEITERMAIEQRQPDPAPSNANTSGLAPCPFCGGEAWLNDYEAKYSDLPPKSRCPQCRSCGASLGYLATPAKATEAWNRRVTAASAQARIAELEALVESYRRTADLEARDCDAAEARADRLASALTDLVSWFDKPVQGERGMVLVIRAGDQGADDAVTESRAALQQEPTT